jgi:hypothetical protein
VGGGGIVIEGGGNSCLFKPPFGREGEKERGRKGGRERKGERESEGNVIERTLLLVSNLRLGEGGRGGRGVT